MADRSEELLKLADLFGPTKAPRKSSSEPDFYGLLTQETLDEGNPLSDFIRTSLKISANMKGNEALVQRMEKLITMKEFSNDPTAAMEEISDLFELKLKVIQKDLTVVKRQAEGREVQQTKQHFYLLLFLFSSSSSLSLSSLLLK